MFLHDTGVPCPLCPTTEKTTIVAEIEWFNTADIMDIPIGPSSAYYQEPRLTSFYCPRCLVVFHHPPGRPEAKEELIQEARRSVCGGRYGFDLD
jgi:hypothetical protein